MSLPVMPRSLAPVLVVVPPQLTMWAGYDVLPAVAASRGPTPPGPALPYTAHYGRTTNVALPSPTNLLTATAVSADIVPQCVDESDELTLNGSQSLVTEW
jgi:hypothetical protein